MSNKITWKGNVGVEFNSFTQKAYNEVLETDPASPNYVGPFKDIQAKYFEYLQAKGRGEDVNNPISIHNLKNINHKNNFFEKEYLGTNICCQDKSTAYTLNSDIKLTVNDDYETKLVYNTVKGIKDLIKEAVKANITSGSFEIDLKQEFQKNIKEETDKLSTYGTCENCNIYMELTSKLNKAFLEITNSEDPNMFISDIVEVDPTLGKLPYTVFTERINAYKEDIDLEEAAKINIYEKENGNFYEGKLLRCTGKDPMNWNFNPEGTIQFSSWLEFKKADLHQTNYYRYCDPDKITFKEFKEKGKTLPVYFLNKDKLQEWKDNTISPTGEMEKNCYPYGASLNIDTYDHNVKLIGEAALYELCDVLASNEALSVNATYDATDNIKYYFDQDFEVFNLKDYGNEIGGSFIYRNLEFEFDYDPQTEEIKLLHFDYSVEDDKTGYYKQIPLPELMKNPAIQEMLIDQIDLQVNTFIAENRYGSLDEMLKAAESKATKGISSRSEKSKDDLEL